jgi:hypothetical protein
MCAVKQVQKCSCPGQNSAPEERKSIFLLHWLLFLSEALQWAVVGALLASILFIRGSSL